MKYSKVTACTAPKNSLLALQLHSQRSVNAIHDCFVVHVTTKHKMQPDHFSGRNFATCFFQSKAFRFESFLLRSIRWCIEFTNSSSAYKNHASFGFGFFRVTEELQNESRNEILLDSGPFLTWLAVTPPSNKQELAYYFGTITKEPNAFIRFVYPVHIWYSKLLLASGVRQHLLSTKSK